ncbi:MAG: lysophospholipid acyltransferase family protein [Oscillospiraceae bacterium]|nr:lysophospholipid acyltransferase family protein [Oscillospiraceae bacterium]
MRTIVWFAYFWVILLRYIPILHRVKKLDQAGKTAERDQLVEQSVAKWARSLLKVAGVQVEISGKENVPDGPAVFVGNHQGNFDIPILLASLDHAYGFVAKIETQKIPLIRSWMKYLHCVFVDRENPRQAVGAIGEAARMVQEGYSVILFPEGTRSRGNQMREFQSGGLRIAAKSQAPVVPVVINGSYQVMEAHGFWIHPAKVRLTILPPISVESMGREEQKQLSVLLHDTIEWELSRQLDK